MTRAATYCAAGVDVAAGDRLVGRIKRLAAGTARSEIVADVGGFAAVFRIPAGYRRPLLVASTDGVGTKLRLAFMLGKHDTVGIDLVAMNVNDLITLGAEPVAFLDYFATGRLRPAVAAAVLRGIAAGCRAAGCALVGGETAEMPSFYAAGEYDLAGFVVGVVEADRVVDGRAIQPGDAVIGLPSSGLHSNGFSLARQLIFERARLRASARPPELRRSVGAELLAPTRIYVSVVRDLLRRHRVKGMAHITGGGIVGNLARILPAGCEAVIRLESWPVPPVFRLLQRLGSVRRAEMFRTFNMGVGFVLVAAPDEARRIVRRLERLGEAAYVIGEIRRGSRRVRLVPPSEAPLGAPRGRR